MYINIYMYFFKSTNTSPSKLRRFYQDGLTGSAWGDWSLYTDSPLRAEADFTKEGDWTEIGAKFRWRFHKVVGGDWNMAHRNSGFSHGKWWFPIVMLVYQRVCFHSVGNFIIPTDFHIFKRGRYTTDQLIISLFSREHGEYDAIIVISLFNNGELLYTV